MNRNHTHTDARPARARTPSLGRIAGAILSNWVAVATTMVIAVFLPPFVVHHLGDAAYGVWILLGSTVAYMGMVDLGLRGAVVHFLATHYSVGNHADAGRAMCAAVSLRVLMASVVLLASAVLALFVNHIFAIPPALVKSAPRVVFLVGANLSISLLSGLFGAVLAALHRFDLLSGITILRAVATAAVTLVLLHVGRGIEALAGAHLAVTFVCGLLTFAAARRVYPELELHLEWPEKRLLSKLWSYSFYLSLISVSAQLIYYSDSVVVGALFSAEAVTFFFIGSGLISYQKQLVAALATTMTPLASSYNAQGEYGRLRTLLVQGSRAAILVSWPIQIVLFVRGETFIRLWMGPHYAVIASRILQILLIAGFLQATNLVSGNISAGLGKHKPYALWQSAEGVVNLVLSIALAHRIGLNGVAWGTTIPNLFTQSVLWPVYVCRMLHLRWSEFIWQVWCRPALAMTPFLAACIYTERAWSSSNLIEFFAQVAAICPLILVGGFWVFRKEIGEQLAHRDGLVEWSLWRFAFGKSLDTPAANTNLSDTALNRE